MYNHAMVPDFPNRKPPSRLIPAVVLLREIMIIICGLTMAVIPLALWVAWSRPIFAGILITCMLSMAIVIVLSRFGEDDDYSGTDETEPGKQRLEGEFFDELHRHVPLVHHHRQLSDPRIRGKMAKLREMVRRSHR